MDCNKNRWTKAYNIRIPHQEVVDISTNPAVLDAMAIPDWARGTLKKTLTLVTRADVGHGVRVYGSPVTGWMPVVIPMA